MFLFVCSKIKHRTFIIMRKSIALAVFFRNFIIKKHLLSWRLVPCHNKISVINDLICFFDLVSSSQVRNTSFPIEDLILTWAQVWLQIFLKHFQNFTSFVLSSAYVRNFYSLIMNFIISKIDLISIVIFFLLLIRLISISIFKVYFWIISFYNLDT